MSKKTKSVAKKSEKNGEKWRRSAIRCVIPRYYYYYCTRVRVCTYPYIKNPSHWQVKGEEVEEGEEGEEGEEEIRDFIRVVTFQMFVSTVLTALPRKGKRKQLAG